MNKQQWYSGFLIAIIALFLGLSGGYWYASFKPVEQQEQSSETNKKEKEIVFYRNPMNPAITSPAPAKDDMGMDYIPVYREEESPKEAKMEKEVLYYRNPMNPAITSPSPAKDEMGMDYIPVYDDQQSGRQKISGTVTIDPVMEQNIGVRTSVAKLEVLNRHIRAVGRVDYNEELLYRIHPKVEGWVEELYVKKSGEQVEKDTILLSIYSPQLVASQQEYLIAINNLNILKNSPFEDIRRGAEELVKSSKRRLQFFDVPKHQLDDLTQNHIVKKSLHIHSPYKGIVLNLGVREGDFINPKTQIYTLADLSKVWVYVDVYEYELPWVKEGDSAEMTIAAEPGKIFEGTVTSIYPYMEAKTRTVRVRLEFDNEQKQLKPDMFANVIIKGGKSIEAVVIPSEAVVRSGKREQIFVRRDRTKFEPREVKVGISTAGLTQILEGLEPGEEVVTSAQFLIDSESKLREATAKMIEALGRQDEPKSSQQPVDMDLDMQDMSLDNLDEKEMDMSDMSLDSI